MDKDAVVQTLKEIANLLEIQGENIFRVNAHVNAARSLEMFDGDFEETVRTNRLQEIKGIGKGIADKITELMSTGRCAELDALRAKTPPGLLDMLRIPGFGPKKAKAVHEHLAIATIEALETACREGKVASLKGFGPKTEQNILAGIEQFKKTAGQFRADVARALADPILETLSALQAVKRCSVAGSLRRWKEVVKDIDFLVATAKPERVMETFIGMPGVETVIVHGPTKSSVRLAGGIQADLRCVTDGQYPFALHYFTGSKEHNTALRHRARKRGLKLNEYGLFPEGKEKSIPCKDEKDIFAALDLDYIPPEMREDLGEIEAAEKHKLPELVEEKDVRSILHMHTKASDGKVALEQYAEWAQGHKIAVMGIADHSQSAAYAGGLSPERVRAQHSEIDKLNEKWKARDVLLLKGIESDILADGSLDYPDNLLSEFDFIVASVHSRFKMDKDTMTRRICRAVENKFTAVLGHPTGRLLLLRESYALDIGEVLDCCARHGTAVEINANPHRLDLDWRHVRAAAQRGCLFLIGPDAHELEGLDDMRYGIGVARKGWLEPRHVLNTWPKDKLLSWLREKRAATASSAKGKSKPKPRTKSKTTPETKSKSASGSRGKTTTKPKASAK